jgi:hypothetical protein
MSNCRETENGKRETANVKSSRVLKLISDLAPPEIFCLHPSAFSCICLQLIAYGLQLFLYLPSAFSVKRFAFSCICLLPSAFRLPPSAFRLQPSAFRLQPSAFSLRR